MGLTLTHARGTISAEHAVLTLQEIHDMSGVDGNPAALFGFAPLGPEQTLPTSTDIIGQLTQIFGPVAATPVEVIIKDWRLDRDALPDPDRQLSAMDTYGGPPLSGSDGRRSDPSGVDRNRL